MLFFYSFFLSLFVKVLYFCVLEGLVILIIFCWRITFLQPNHTVFLVQNDINILVQSFFDHTLNLIKINHASIILIPKNKEGNTLDSYSPITLISVKIIIKILANSISVVIDNLIDNSQVTSGLY
jgi:hypothetical protein